MPTTVYAAIDIIKPQNLTKKQYEGLQSVSHHSITANTELMII